jgi:hypothetical protein
MPNRILKESICTSETLDKLNDFQENFFYRLIVNCDDYGRMDARPAILKARLYPLRERLTLKDIDGALRALAAVGCVEVYEVDGKPYLQLPSWEVHQTIRAKKSRYPGPESGVKAIASNCKQLQADVPVIQSNPIQSESESEGDMCRSAPPAAAPEDTVPPDAAPADTVASIILNDKTEYHVSTEQAQHWQELFPGVDVEQELRKMVAWCEANPTRRKTRKGVQKFITGWLSREQDSGRTLPAGRKGQEAPPSKTYDTGEVEEMSQFDVLDE